jgi:xanthine dehydrogenase YagT iron-sulfur-binding subunit
VVFVEPADICRVSVELIEPGLVELPLELAQPTARAATAAENAAANAARRRLRFMFRPSIQSPRRRRVQSGNACARRGRTHDDRSRFVRASRLLPVCKGKPDVRTMDRRDDDGNESSWPSLSRREVLIVAAAGAAGLREAGAAEPDPAPASGAAEGDTVPSLRVSFEVNGEARTLDLDTRTTLLDALREHLHLTGTKKGCDHGQCGACTAIVDGRRINTCLTLAVMHEGAKVTTIEGLGTPQQLHPMQAAFIKHDGYQCGYCTPGQICSAVATLVEIEQGIPSHVSADLTAKPMLSGAELRERMSGNICRCGAYSNIAEAIGEVAGMRT